MRVLAHETMYEENYLTNEVVSFPFRPGTFSGVQNVVWPRLKMLRLVMAHAHSYVTLHRGLKLGTCTSSLQ